MKTPVFQDKAVVEKLIGLVRNHPVLYDASIPEHRDAETVNIVWTNISFEMGICYVDADGWKRKWRNLRDTYVKQKKMESMSKRQKIGLRKKPWRFTNIMKFLDTVLDLKSLDSLFHPPCDEEDEGGETSDISGDESASCTERSSMVSGGSHKTGNGQVNEPQESRLEMEDQAQFSPSRKILGKRPCYSDDQSIDGGDTTSNVHRKRSGQFRFVPVEDTDGDEAFFQSCAHRMRKLPAQTRSFLKLQITQLFVNAENPDIAPLPITPLPGHQMNAENPGISSTPVVPFPVDQDSVTAKASSLPLMPVHQQKVENPADSPVSNPPQPGHESSEKWTHQTETKLDMSF